MSGPENTFISSVHRHLPVGLYYVKNNNPYNSGIPDVWYSGKLDLWIEYKFIVVPSREGTVIDLVGGKAPALSHLQQNWLRSRYEEGRNVGVIVGCKTGGAWFPCTSWMEPLSAGVFRTRITSRAQLACTILDFVRGTGCST